jgi:hypothetical protein
MMANLHTVHMSGGWLALECRSCKHRTVLEENKWRDVEGRAYIHRGNMQSIESLKFVCSKCKSRDIKWLIPHSWEDAELFLAGYQIKTNHER